MAQSKKELVLAAMDNKPVDRVPTGFWFHFLKDEVKPNAFEQPELNDEVVKGEEHFVDTFQPDMIKIMTDGYFMYENETAKNLTCAADFKKIKPLPDDAKWFTDQIAYAKKITSKYGEHTATFYNVFCAGTTVKFMHADLEHSEEFLASVIREDADAVKAGLDVISGDLAKLAKRLITEGSVTGIYFSLQTLIGDGITEDIYRKVFTPGEKEVLAAANSVSDYNIMHICGYAGHRNNFNLFKDYDVKTINWAAVVEDLPLEEGKKFFGGRCALGGFGNLTSEVLYKGTKEEIQAETKRLLDQAGRTGIILGADCTIPRDTNWDHLEWVREAAK